MPPTRWNPRKLFRFSLTSLAVCLTLFCVALGILANRVRQQRNAVRALLAAGCRVSYEGSLARGSSVFYLDESKNPGWLRRRLGEDWFSSVHGVTFYSEGCNDDTLQHLKAIPT